MIEQPYDAVIVLGGGITKGEGYFTPTTFADSDPFGMLGGAIRIAAAVEVYKRHTDALFVFSSGTTAKTIEQYGTDVPTEAVVYSQTFIATLQTFDLPLPGILLEEKSVNTSSNVQEALRLIQAHGWQHVAVITSDYHVARVAALFKMLAKTPRALPVVCLSAEAIVKHYLPGMYNKEIALAYKSSDAQRRIKNEATGLATILRGEYTMTEFQL